MRQAVIALVVLAAVALSFCGSARGDYIEVRDVTMRLDKDQAIFELNYTLVESRNYFAYHLSLDA